MMVRWQALSPKIVLFLLLTVPGKNGQTQYVMACGRPKRELKAEDPNQYLRKRGESLNTAPQCCPTNRHDILYSNPQDQNFWKIKQLGLSSP